MTGRGIGDCAAGDCAAGDWAAGDRGPGGAVPAGARGTGYRTGRHGAWPMAGVGLGLGLRWGARHIGGRFAGRSFGGRRFLGRRNRFASYGAVNDDPWNEASTRAEASQALEAQAGWLRSQLEALEEHIASLRGGENESDQDR